MSIYEMRTTYEQLRTPSRWEMSWSLKLQGWRTTTKSLWNTSTIIICHWWFYSKCWASHAALFWFSWPVAGFCWTLTNHKTHQVYSCPAEKYLMMLTLTVFHSHFFPDLLPYIMYDSATKMYYFDLKITAQPSFQVLSLFIILKQLQVIQITSNPSQILHTTSH